MPDNINTREGFTLYGYRTNLVGGVQAVDSGGTLDNNFLTFLDGIGITSTFRFNNAPGFPSIFCRFSVSPETLTGQPTGSQNDGNSRFVIEWSGSNTPRLNPGNNDVSSHTGETRFSTSRSTYGTSGANPAYVYAVGDSLGLAIFAVRQNGLNSFFSPINYVFSYFGYCRNPAYGGANYPLDYISMIQAHDTGSRIWRPSATNSNSSSVECSIEPSITCDTTTSGANTSDVIFRDNPSPNYAIGRARPFLLWTNQALTLNTIHRVINKGNNPYLVVAVAGSGRLMMPVWTEGLT